MSETVEPAAETLPSALTPAKGGAAPSTEMDRPKPKEDRPLSNWAQIVSALFAGLSFLLAACAFVAVLYQVTLIRDNAAIATARQVYMAYDQLAISHPEFTEPDFEKLKAGDPKDFVRYKVFLSNMLWAYDEMLHVYDDPQRQRSFHNDIRHHLTYICAQTEPSDFLVFSRKMRDLLSEIRSNCPPKS